MCKIRQFLKNTTKQISNNFKYSRSCCGTRRIPVFVEPIMILYYMSHLPAYKMRSQFLYDKLARENGLYSSTNKTHSSGSNCGLNQSSTEYALQQKVCQAGNGTFFAQIIVLYMQHICLAQKLEDLLTPTSPL